MCVLGVLGHIKGITYLLHYGIRRHCQDSIDEAKLSLFDSLFNNKGNILFYGTPMVFYVCIMFFSWGWLVWLSTIAPFFSLITYSSLIISSIHNIYAYAMWLKPLLGSRLLTPNLFRVITLTNIFLDGESSFSSYLLHFGFSRKGWNHVANIPE